jgi:hypothetical protein
MYHRFLLGQFFFPVLLIAVLTLLCMKFYKNTDVYGYDEADYKYASEKGIAANYLDQPVLPIKTFLASGSNLGSDKSKRTELSEIIRSADDISFYRHYHGPLYSYWLNLLDFFGAASERSFRGGTLILLGLTGMILLWAGIRVHNISTACALLPVVLLFGSEMNILTAAILTPHAIYCVTSLAALVFLSKFLITNKMIDWYLALLMLSFAMLSIEYAVLVATTFAICLFIFRKKIFVRIQVWTFLLRSIGLLLLSITVFWLGGIIKLTLLKNYIFFAYFTIFRGGEYGSGNFTDVWAHRFANSPVICVIAVATLIFFIVRIKKNYQLLPYFIYPALVLVTSLRNTSPSPTYVSSIFPPIFLPAGMLLFEISKGTNKLIPMLTTATVTILCICYLNPEGNSGNTIDSETTKAVMSYLRSEKRTDTNIFVPRIYLPALHYYFQGKHFSGYAEEFDDPAAMAERLSQKPVSGFLCRSSNMGRYLSVLREHYAVTSDTLHDATGTMILGIYFQLLPLRLAERYSLIRAGNSFINGEPLAYSSYFSIAKKDCYAKTTHAYYRY